jgi:hypothetical protein
MPAAGARFLVARFQFELSSSSINSFRIRSRSASCAFLHDLVGRQKLARTGSATAIALQVRYDVHLAQNALSSEGDMFFGLLEMPFQYIPIYALQTMEPRGPI